MGLGKVEIMHKRSFWVSYLISELHCIECRLIPALIDDETAVKRYYKKKAGKDIDLDNPKTFSEKINWYKLNDRNPLMAKCADKIGVRDYITEKGYGNCLNEIYGIYDKVSDIDLDKLPDSFVLKAAHGSHMNIIVKDKSEINWHQAKMMMSSWLRQNIYWSGREWVYKDIPKRIVAEKYLEDEHGELRDYKFFCFNGIPQRLEYDIGRFKGEQYRNWYNIDKTLIYADDGTPYLETEYPTFTDEQFEQMKSIAADLSSEFQHVRVDFYIVHGKIYIGELTFFDGGGSTIFTPDEWNYKFSEDWTIVK